MNKLHAYISSLALLLVGLLAFSVLNGFDFFRDLPAWLVLTVSFAMVELADLLFHRENSRLGLSASETVLLPLIVGFDFGHVVWAATIAMTVSAIADKRVNGMKAVFNIAELGVAAAAAAALWGWLHEPALSLTPRNAAVAVLAVVLYALLTHIMVLIAVALATDSPIRLFDAQINEVLGWNLAGNVIMGVFFAAALLGALWTVVLFPVALTGLYFSYRAIVRQRVERERVVHLHTATRALASSRALDQALIGFLHAVGDVASSREVHSVIRTRSGWSWSAVSGDTVLADMVPMDAGPLGPLMNALGNDPQPLIVSGTEQGRPPLLVPFEAHSLIAVPVLEGDAVVGCVAAIDRVGADEFSTSEQKLLETLADELQVTLDSYRLFEEVAEERERFRKIFDASKEGICLIDGLGAVQAWNPAARRITGYTAAEIEGKVWSDFIAVRSEEQERLVGLGVTEVSPDAELELVTKEGPSRWISILSSPVRGQDEGWVVLIRDVTSEHILEESKSDFLSTISHELRTPLTTIKGSVQVLNRKKAEQSPIQQQMLSVLQRGTDRLERLVLNLLFVSQLDVNEGIKVHPEEVPLEEIVRTRVEVMAMDHPDVTLMEPEGPIIARADRERMLQVIDHLIENAVKFSPEAPIEIRTGTEGGFAYLSVKDGGPGIPRVDHERIFERFVRLGNVLTRETQGPGVGLFIVKKAIEAMGGQVHLESAPGQGSTFTVTVPLGRPVIVAEAPA